jgi:hypothetical protein
LLGRRNVVPRTLFNFTDRPKTFGQIRLCVRQPISVAHLFIVADSEDGLATTERRRPLCCAMRLNLSRTLSAGLRTPLTGSCSADGSKRMCFSWCYMYSSMFMVRPCSGWFRNKRASVPWTRSLGLSGINLLPLGYQEEHTLLLLVVKRRSELRTLAMTSVPQKRPHVWLPLAAFLVWRQRLCDTKTCFAFHGAICIVAS